jgi:TorA maturation chaperone TorD
MPNYDLDQGKAREDLCRYLAACYYQPGPEFVEEKVFDSMLSAAIRIHPDLAAQARRLGEAFAAEGAEDLLLDYTRLFLGPNHIIAKPYGSVWLDQDGPLMGDSTVAVLSLYQEGGFDIDEGFRELPDHIAAELEFLYLLIFRENEAHQLGKPKEQEIKAALRKRFLGEHLGRWVTPFTTAVREGAETLYYRELAELTDKFINLEAGNLSPQNKL